MDILFIVVNFPVLNKKYKWKRSREISSRERVEVGE